MKLKLTAHIKKEALIPGMEQAVQDVQLQKELNKPGMTQMVDARDSALNQITAKYPNGGNWNSDQLQNDIASYMDKYYPGKLYAVGIEGPNLLNDKMFQRDIAINAAQVEIAKNGKNVVNKVQSEVAARKFFTDSNKTIYVLVY